MQEIIHSIVQLITAFIQDFGYLAVFVLMTAESALIPIPSEVTMPFAGFMTSQGTLNFWTVVFVGAFGNLVGSWIAYALGYYKGESWVRVFIKRWGKWLLIREEEFDRAKMWFEKYGQGVAFGSRLLPIVRTFISLPAGIARMNLLIFSILTFIGSFIWSAFLTYLGYQLGQNWQAIEPYFRQFQFVIIAILFGGFVFYIRTHMKRRH